jgi:hypothetical protein
MMVSMIGSACRRTSLNRIHAISIFIIVWILIIGIAGLCCAETPSGVGTTGKVGCQVVCDKYAIAFDGYDDSQPDSMEFRYLVSVEGGTCGLNSWVLELPSCVNRDAILDAGPGSWEFVESAGLLGIKFDGGIEQPESGKPANSFVYYLRLKGPDWSLKQMPEMRAVFEASTETCEKNVEVPGCPVPS